MFLTNNLHKHLLYSNDAPGLKEANKNVEMLLQKPGVGTRCMNPSVHQIE